MSKSFEFPNVGTCSKLTKIVLNDDHTIESIEVVGGCHRADGGNHLRPPPHQLPRPDRKEPEKGTGRAVICRVPKAELHVLCGSAFFADFFRPDGAILLLSHIKRQGAGK